MSLELREPTHVDEPQKVQEYADVLSRVAADKQAVIVRRGGMDLAAVVPLEVLQLVQNALAREEALRLARALDRERLVAECRPPQIYFDRDEPKPF